MTPSPKGRLGYNAALILSALEAGAGYGLDVIDRTGLSAGTVYPALRRLEETGRIAGEWEEEVDAHTKGRPARRYYSITSVGQEALAEAKAQIAARQRSLGWVDPHG